MATITLISDQGSGNHDLARFRHQLKLRLAATDFELITADINRHQVTEAAFVLDAIIPDFQSETIHIVDVESDMLRHGPALIARVSGQWIICANNALLSLIRHDKDAVYEAPKALTDNGKTFTLLNTFLPIAEHLISQGEKGLTVAQNIQEKSAIAPVIAEDAIRGTIIFVDNFGNSITNITRQEYERAAAGRSMNIRLNRHTRLKTITEHYGSVDVGEAVCVWTNHGYLQISVYHGNASRLLGLEKGGMVTIDFA